MVLGERAVSYTRGTPVQALVKKRAPAGANLASNVPVPAMNVPGSPGGGAGRSNPPAAPAQVFSKPYIYTHYAIYLNQHLNDPSARAGRAAPAPRRGRAAG